MPACSGDLQLGWSDGGGNPGLNRPNGYVVQHLGTFLVLGLADYCTAGGCGSRTHLPLGCKPDKRPGAILMNPSVAFFGEGELYLLGEPILLQELTKGDSQRKKKMPG